MKRPTILSLEQALTLPYATQRFVQLGWRVIRIESPPDRITGRGGDPNRYIGDETEFDDLHSYYIAPNLGKEAITLNLHEERGRRLLADLVKKLPADVFLCNTLPMRYERLGIDFETLCRFNPRLIWCGISAFGPENPKRAGYDPALQAELGYMFLTGEPDRDPMLCGLPIIDLKTGDEAFAQVLLAMLEREGTGSRFNGRQIDISMARCAASWLITALPQLQFTDDEEKIFTRSGNEHRSFFPCNCYPTHDSYVYLAIGNDLQWQKLIRIKGFEHLDQPHRKLNEGRRLDRENIYADIRRGLKQFTTAEFIRLCLEQNLAVAPVQTTKEVAVMEVLQKAMISTTLPSSKTVPLFPAAVQTEFLSEQGNRLPLSPRLGEHNANIYREIGLNKAEIEILQEAGVI